MHFINAAILALAAEASAETIRVEVGKGGLKYTPDSITPAKGDVVEFHFDSMHTVVAGDPKKPCTPATSGGFYSGELPSDNNVSGSLLCVPANPCSRYFPLPSTTPTPSSFTAPSRATARPAWLALSTKVPTHWRRTKRLLPTRTRASLPRLSLVVSWETARLRLRLVLRQLLRQLLRLLPKLLPRVLRLRRLLELLG